MRRSPLKLDESIAVAVAVFVDPLERTQRGLLEVARERDVVRPAPHFGEEDEIQRRRVDSAVVAREPRLRRLPVPDLVHDLPRLGVDRGIVLARLQVREHLERAARELWPEEQRLQTRDQRVAAEHRHEPRHARGRKLAEVALRIAAHAQRCEIADRLVERAGELVPVGAQLRYTQLPCRQRVPDVASLLAETPLDLNRRDDGVRLRRHDVDAKLPALARLELHRERHRRAVHVSDLREDDLRPQRVLAVDEHELVVLRIEAVRRGIRQRLRSHRVAEREIVLLHGKNRREVGLELEPELERDRIHALVFEHDDVLHPLADEPLARDRHLVLPQAADERIAEVERGREVLDLARGERQGRRAVHRELQPREETGVLREEAARLLADVADLVADAEGRAFEDGEHHANRERFAFRTTAPKP